MQSTSYSNAPDLEQTSERQAALRRYHILDTAPEKNFDRITSLVAKVCDVPTALITLIDTERQWFKSCFGFDARETDIGVSFCVHAVHEGEMLVVEDATEDPRFKDNPIVTGPPHIRFYAGAPLTTPEGVHIGTLCIIDYEPKPFDAAQREILERLADVVVNEFEHRSAEAQVRQLFEENPQPMYIYDVDTGHILDVNDGATTQYGYSEEAFLSLTHEDLKAAGSKQPSSDVIVHRHRDGSPLPVRLREHDILYDGRDARLAVAQLVASHRDTASTVFFRTDADGAVQSLSAAWPQATGFSIEETVGSDLLDFVHPLDRSSTETALSPLLNDEADICRHEARLLTEEGAQPFEIEVRRVYDEDGAPSGTAGSLTPVIEHDREEPGEEDEADTSEATDEEEDAEPTDAEPSDEPDSSSLPSGLPEFDEPAKAAPEPEPSPDAPSPDLSGSTSLDLDPTPFDIVGRLRDVLDNHNATAEEIGVSLERDLPDTSLPVRLDPRLVDVAGSALIAHALRHPTGEAVTVSLSSSVNEITLHIDGTEPVDEGDSSPIQHLHRLADHLGEALQLEREESRLTLTLPRSLEDESEPDDDSSVFSPNGTTPSREEA